MEEITKQLKQPVAAAKPTVRPRQQAAEQAQQEPPNIYVNGVAISAHDVALETQYHPAKSKKEAQFLAAQALVINELLQQEAEKLGIKATPLSSESQEEANLRVLLEQEVQQPSITATDCQQFYDSNPLKFTTAPLVSARHILIAADPKNALERSKHQEQVQGFIQELQNGADFATFAREYSACSSKQHGGSLGQISKGQTVPEFEKALFKLPLGLAPKAIESRYGYHIVEVQQHLRGKLLPFNSVQKAISQELEERVWHKSTAQYLQILVGQATITGITLAGADSPLLQ